MFRETQKFRREGSKNWLLTLRTKTIVSFVRNIQKSWIFFHWCQNIPILRSWNDIWIFYTNMHIILPELWKYFFWKWFFSNGGQESIDVTRCRKWDQLGIKIHAPEVLLLLSKLRGDARKCSFLANQKFWNFIFCCSISK